MGPAHTEAATAGSGPSLRPEQRTVRGAATSRTRLRKAQTSFRTWWERENVSDMRRSTEPSRPRRPRACPAAPPAHDATGR
ncbi:hypothetical protein GCM10012285_51680 [Streptomyces kronopolitis]|uniref:Integrase n=1 Tax=Streptomyces kronopolitis TaxID=1612435 RepID=A0ABQ2JVV5_9ACTN|nr:hypothetical protein GCM10012285_51680 [Streptomyces kronopolitis]